LLIVKGAKEQQMKGQVNMRRVLKLAGPILALRYRRAAQRDENNGLPFTAAMEWRRAAELSSWITLLANRYWREWERIMHLPRRLAGPIGLAPVPIAPLHQTSSSLLTATVRPLAQHPVTLHSAA
jgi:hypothetical protein